MLKVYQTSLKRAEIRHTINKLKESNIDYHKDYIEFLERKLEAYDLEETRARKREVKNVEL